MFSPEGFISLFEIRQELANVAAQWRENTPHPDDTPREVAGFLDFNIDTGWARETAYGDWLLQNFLNREERNLYACLPNGAVLRLSGQVVQRHHFTSGEFADDPKSWHASVEHLEDGFTFLDPVYFVIRTDRIEEYERGAFGVSVDVLRPIENCPVCWKLPEPQPDWLTICGTSLDSPPRNRGGRPRKVGVVAAAYLELFPNGAGALTRDQIWSRIRDSKGIEFSTDTLDRAIKLAKESAKP